MREVYLVITGLFLGDMLYFFRLGRRVEGWFSRLANRQGFAVALCAAVSMLPRLAVLYWLRPPEPIIPDEFSFVLGAKTFALGRLTNPVPLLWQHFESLHINVVPSYQMMYQPAPSLFLALGIVTGGNPWWGVWLSCGLMCAAICWALQPLIRPKYALLAGLYCALKYGMFTQYGDSYWGGSVSALGAAVTLGAFVRLMRTRRAIYVPVLVIGVALLANSRPFEGTLFAVPIGVAFLYWIYRSRLYLRVLVPTAALLALLGAAMAYYNYRSTGNAREMPYVANYHQYHYVQPFLGMKELPKPDYRHYQMAKLFETWEGRPGKIQRTRKGIEFLTVNKYKYYYMEHFAPLMILALVGLGYAVWPTFPPFAARRMGHTQSRPRSLSPGPLRSGSLPAVRSRFLIASTFLLVMAGLFAVVWWPLSSYPAPLLVSFFGLAFLGMRYLRVLRFRGHKAGYYWARGLVVVLAVTSLLTWHDNFQWGKRMEWAFPVPWNIERQRIIHQLENEGGRHLLIVKYSHLHVPHQEWVYNPPDMDHAKVLFAQTMGNAQDCELVRYYAPRKIWFLYPDGGPWPQLVAVDPDRMNCTDNDVPLPNVIMAKSDVPLPTINMEKR